MTLPETKQRTKLTLEQIKTKAKDKQHFSEWNAAVIELLAKIEENTRK